MVDCFADKVRFQNIYVIRTICIFDYEQYYKILHIEEIYTHGFVYYLFNTIIQMDFKEWYMNAQCNTLHPVTVPEMCLISNIHA